LHSIHHHSGELNNKLETDPTCICLTSLNADACVNGEIIEPGNSCSVVRGRLSVYGVFASEDEVSRLQEEVIGAIKLGMEEDSFIYAHQSLVRLYFVERNSVFPPIVTPNQVGSVDLRADSDGPFPWVIAAAVASLVIFGTLVGWRKLRRNQEDEDEDEDNGKEEHSIFQQMVKDVASIASHREMDMEDASIYSSESSGTQKHEGISAIYGIADADGYRQFSVHSLSDISECPSISSSTGDASEGASDTDRSQSTLGIAARDENESEIYLNTNRILFSPTKSNSSESDGSDDSDISWKGGEKGGWKKVKVSGKDWCCLCYKKAGNLPMKKCECGKPSDACDKWAHVLCISNRGHTQSLSHPGTPPPALPNVLCSAGKEWMR